MFDLKSYLAERAGRVNQALDQLLPAVDLQRDQEPQAQSPIQPDRRTVPLSDVPVSEAEVLYQAMRYSVFAGGKRLRPILFTAAAEAVGGEAEGLLPFACALELIHTYSLIHDDLPAMDDDDLRRGQPTCHIKFGEAQAILAGDALLTYAFNLMIGVRQSGVDAGLVLSAMDEVAWSSGLRGMIVGQVLDLAAEGVRISLPQLRQVHRYKTGALFQAALVSGGILGGGSQEQLAALAVYAEEFGLAFQITDDILDVTGDQEKLGKPIGSDAKNQKSTYPSLLGLDPSRQLAREAAEKAAAALDCFGPEAEPLRALARQVVARES